MSRRVNSFDNVFCCGMRVPQREDSCKCAKKFKLINLLFSRFKCKKCRSIQFVCELCVKAGSSEPAVLKYNPSYFAQQSRWDKLWMHLMNNHTDRYKRSYNTYTDSYTCVYDTGPNILLVNCFKLLDYYCQLPFVKWIDNDTYSKIIDEQAERMTKSHDEHRALTRAAFDISRCEEFSLWFKGFIIGLNYKCDLCGERYEDGLPSIEMVAVHLLACETQN